MQIIYSTSSHFKGNTRYHILLFLFHLAFLLWIKPKTVIWWVCFQIRWFLYLNVLWCLNMTGIKIGEPFWTRDYTWREYMLSCVWSVLHIYNKWNTHLFAIQLQNFYILMYSGMHKVKIDIFSWSRAWYITTSPSPFLKQSKKDRATKEK